LPVLGVWLLAPGQRTESRRKTETCSSLPITADLLDSTRVDIF
jgi:hypothetical protein